MITDFCVICGTKEKLHNHHIVPKARGGGDESTNMLTLCETHHEWIHQVRPGTYNKMSELAKIKQKEGIEKAKKLGKYKGRKKSIDRDKVRKLWENGMGGTKISKEMNIGRASLYRVLRELDYDYESKWTKNV